MLFNLAQNTDIVDIHAYEFDHTRDSLAPDLALCDEGIVEIYVEKTCFPVNGRCKNLEVQFIFWSRLSYFYCRFLVSDSAEALFAALFAFIFARALFVEGCLEVAV